MKKRSVRRKKLHQYNVAWMVAVGVAVVLVVIGVVGLAVTDGSGEPGQTTSLKPYLFVALGGIGAVIGLVSTIIRARGGDKVDEAELDT